jgi:TP901 family phage tail tape measure protein
MANKTTQWILELVDKMSEPCKAAAAASDATNVQIDKMLGLLNKLERQSDSTGGKLEKFGKGMFLLNQTADAFSQLNSEFQNVIDPGVKFQYAMADMQAITGQTGEVIDDLGEKARSTAKVFGGDAASAVDLFKVYLSKLTPELAKSPEALSIMSNNAFVLSKTMGGDVAGAVDVLTTAMNQFQVSTDDPIEAAKTMTDMMNIMAAGAREGSAEIPSLKSALEQTGMMAKMANVSFAETNSALQVLDKAGKKGAEGGVALRNVMTTLSQGRYLPRDVLKELEHAGISTKDLTNKSKTLSERLQALKPIMQDDALLSKMFGRENTAAALALLSNIPLMDQYTKAIQGTSTATDQASIIMDTYSEKTKKTQSWIDDLKISFFESTESLAPFMTMVGDTAEFITKAGIAVFAFSQIMQIPLVASFAAASKAAIAWAFTTVTGCETITAALYAMPFFGWIALGITVITSVATYFYKTSEKFRAILWGAWEGVKSLFNNIGKFIIEVGKGYIEILSIIFNPMNWFSDDKTFEKAFSKITNAAVNLAKNFSSDVKKGYAEGINDFRNSNGDGFKRVNENGKPAIIKSEDNKGNNALTIYTPPKSGVKLDPNAVQTNTGTTRLGRDKNGSGSGLSGIGGSKTVNMTVNFVNHFAMTGKTDIKAVADQVMQQITGVLRDATIALD